MRFRLHRLSSEPQFFDPITFSEGINLILGEKADDGQLQANKVNGVGKSLCVEFIHFALLRSFEKTRVAKIPAEHFPPGLTIILDLSINGEVLQIRRSVESPDAPVIVRADQTILFGNLEEATRFLGDLLFSPSDTDEFRSFRRLMSLLIRNEASGFSDILKTMPAATNAPADRLPHLYLLGLDGVQYRELLDRIKELDNQKRLVTQLKADVTQRGAVAIGNVQAELNREEKEVTIIERGLEQLRAEPAFAQVEADLNDLEARLAKQRAIRKSVGYQLGQIRSMPAPETIDETDVRIIYDRVRAGLGELVVKSLEQAQAFQAEVQTFQRSLWNEEAKRLEGEYRKLSDDIRALSDKHAELVAQVDNKGTLRELKTGLHIALQKQQDYYRRSALYVQFREAEERKEDLISQRQQALDGLRRQLQAHQDVEVSMNREVAEIHERIMGIREASFSFRVNSAANVKHPLELDLRIPDDGSLSVNRTKVFIYDCALMFASCTQKRHPRFLLHDNIFDVDQDTLVQCLNYLHEKIEDGEDFQYVLTLNREKIESEERSHDIQLDINAARVASFTKAHPFLGFRYVETHKHRKNGE